MDISVIIPLYKGQKYIDRLMQMLNRNILFGNLYKTCQIEVIFVNDYPKEEIILGENHLFNVLLLNQEQNMGIQASRIKGISEARGIYIIMFDQDDLVEDNWLYSQWNTIRQADGTYCVCNGWNSRFKKLWRVDDFLNQVNNVDYYLTERNPIRSPGQVIIKKANIPKEWLNHVLDANGADDFLLWIIALKKGNQFVINEDMLFLHTPDRTADSITSPKMIKSLEETLSVLKTIGILNVREEDALVGQIFRISCCYEDRMKNIVLGTAEKSVLKISEYRRVRDVADIYHLWFQMKNQGLNFGEYLRSYGIKSVAIYGMGVLGSDLYEDLKKDGVNVVYAIDQAAVDFEKELKIYQIKDDIEQADITIVTVTGCEEQLIDIVQKKTGGKAMALKDLLVRIVSHEKCF